MNGASARARTTSNTVESDVGDWPIYGNASEGNLNRWLPSACVTEGQPNPGYYPSPTERVRSKTITSAVGVADPRGSPLGAKARTGPASREAGIDTLPAARQAGASAPEPVLPEAIDRAEKGHRPSKRPSLLAPGLPTESTTGPCATRGS
jgi:hypothetical protein